MKSSTILLLIIVANLVFSGCTHTYIARNPVRSPDDQYKLGVSSHGASGKAYTDTTKKRVFVWLGPHAADNPAPPLYKKYVFMAADLDWDTKWNGNNEVTIDFFDYGEGVSQSGADSIPKNPIASLTFIKTEDGAFIEVGNEWDGRPTAEGDGCELQTCPHPSTGSGTD